MRVLRAISTLATLAIALTYHDRPLAAQEPPESLSSTVRAERLGPLEGPRPRSELLPPLLRALPRSTPIALYVPRIDAALLDLERAREVLDLVDKSLSRKLVELIAVRALSLEGAPGSELSSWIPGMRDARAIPSWSELTTAKELVALGLDPAGSAILVRNLTEDALVVGFALSSRPRFEQWLARISGGELGHLAISGEQASVLGPDSDLPITCLSRQSHGYCQVGLSRGGDPIAALKAVVRGGGPTLDQTGITRAIRGLPDDAHAYLVINSDPAVKVATKLIALHAQRRHRFDAPLGRKRAQERALAMIQRVRQYGEIVDGAVLGLYFSRDDVTVRTELALTERGGKLARELSSARESGEVIARWSNTPVLARLLVRMRADHAHELFSALGFSVPESTLSGTLALLLFGIDTECPLAKKGQPNEDRLGWAFLLPSAIAVGLDAPRSADVVQHALASAIAKDAVTTGRDGSGTPASVAVVPQAGLRSPESRPPLSGRAFGSSFEIHVLDDLVLVGTGPGSGAAALRRLESLPPSRGPRTAEPVPFLEGSINLRAVDAAFAAGNFDDDNRSDLIMLAAVRQRLKPLLERVSEVRFSARAVDRRARIDLELRR